MKLIALASFKYNGTEVKAGIFDGTEADLRSMESWGPVRPATSTEIEELGAVETAEAKRPARETAARKSKP